MFINARLDILKMTGLKLANRVKAITTKNPSRIFFLRYQQQHSIIHTEIYIKKNIEKPKQT